MLDCNLDNKDRHIFTLYFRKYLLQFPNMFYSTHTHYIYIKYQNNRFDLASGLYCCHLALCEGEANV